MKTKLSVLFFAIVSAILFSGCATLKLAPPPTVYIHNGFTDATLVAFSRFGKEQSIPVGGVGVFPLNHCPGDTEILFTVSVYKGGKKIGVGTRMVYNRSTEAYFGGGRPPDQSWEVPQDIGIEYFKPVPVRLN